MPPPNFDLFVKLVPCVVDIPMYQIRKLRDKISKQLGCRSCSTFDVIAATIWQNRTRAISCASDEDVSMNVPMDARRFLQQDNLALVSTANFNANAYYGNCLHQLPISTTARKVAEADLADIIKIIMDAKDSVPEKFQKLLNGETKIELDPLMASDRSFLVNDWRHRLDNETYDFGWGSPFCTVPFMEVINACIIVRSPPAKQPEGIRLFSQFLKQEHLDSFTQQFNYN